MELGVHLPLIGFDDEPLSFRRLAATVDAARESGFTAISANDHFVFQRPWLDGLTALAGMVERSGQMELATTITLAGLRGPVPLAKALVGIDVLSEGRVVAGVGPGSSERDYGLVGVPFEERWKRFDEALDILRALVRGGEIPERPRYFPVPGEVELAPGPWRDEGIPIWVGSWGSPAGLARVTRAADGWLASAYNTTPDGFAKARHALPDGFPSALATMWTWIANDPAEADRMLGDVLAPMLGRDPVELGAQVCVGSAEECAELLSRYADAGCDRVYLWPLGDEPRQLELIANEVAPRFSP